MCIFFHDVMIQCPNPRAKTFYYPWQLRCTEGEVKGNNGTREISLNFRFPINSIPEALALVFRGRVSIRSCMTNQTTRTFRKLLPWMSSDALALGELDETRQPAASYYSRQGLGNDGQIDIESQLPPTTSNETGDMASSGDPGTSPEPGVSYHEGVGDLQGGDGLAAVLLTESSSNPGGNTFPISINVHSAINVHSPPSPILEEPDGEPKEGEARWLPERPRDSWDYHADDSFEIKEEVAISEIEQEVALPLEQVADAEPEQQEEDQAVAPPGVPSQEQQHEIRVPTITRIKSELRQKLHLSDLILPAPTDEPPSPADAHGGGPNEAPVEGLGETSPNDSIIGDLPLITTRRKPPRPTLYRVKTRLQDPPPMTPAVADQMASLWSDTATRSRRTSTAVPPLEDEAGMQQARFGPAANCRVRPPKLKDEGAHVQLRFGPTASRKASLSGGDTAGGGAVPVAVPSRLGLFSPSRLGLLSPSRMGLFSTSKANLAPPPDEEKDPLDDDSIPTYKKLKKRPRKWLITFQCALLVGLIIVLIFAVKFRVLKMVIWREIALWQWLALAIVVLSGRLIAGWCVLILVALIERHYILKRRVLYFVYGLRHAVKNCIWLALVIGVWKLVFKNIQEDDKTNSTNIVTRVLWCLFTTSALWMVKILAVKVAANSFHRAAYFDRVQDCLFHQYVLETLSAPSLEDPHRTTPDRNPLEIPSPHCFGTRVVEPQLEHHLHHAASGKHSEFHPGFPGQLHQRSKEMLATTVEGEEESPHPRITLARAPSRSYLSPTGSQRTLATSSRMNLVGGPAARESHSPLVRARRVSVNMDLTPMLARSAVPIGQDKLQELTSETVSAWTLKRLMKMIRKTNIATFSSILEKESGESIESEAQAKAAAKKIFYNVAKPGEKLLSLSDFLYFLPEEQATRAFGLFELNDAGHITKKSLMKWVVNVYKERRSLALTLSDNRTVVAKLHRVLDVLLIGIAITISFLIMGVNTQKLLVAFSSVLLPSVFVFGNAARSTFESLIFLFVMHPFDVGDRICVDGQQMLVENAHTSPRWTDLLAFSYTTGSTEELMELEQQMNRYFTKEATKTSNDRMLFEVAMDQEMNILNTIFLSGSNEKLYYPNSVLATKAISNFYRSPDQWDAIEFQIHSVTTVESLGLLKERMAKYIEGLPQFWYPVFRIVCKDIEDSNKMRMAIWMQHHLNYQESGERWQRRSNMILHLKTCMEELGIGYHLPRQEVTVTGIPVFDVPPPHHATPI